MASFDIAHRLTATSEGGYVNHRHDRGGETYKGIARRFHPHWPGWSYIDELKKSSGFPSNIDDKHLTALVHHFYKSNFWDKVCGDVIPDQDTANLLYDIAVNMGSGTAGRFLQRIINLLNRNGRDYADIKVDGQIGKQTIKSLKRLIRLRGKWIVLFYLFVQMGGRWVGLASKHRTQETFMNGWGNRAISQIKYITDNYYRGTDHET